MKKSMTVMIVVCATCTTFWMDLTTLPNFPSQDILYWIISCEIGTPVKRCGPFTKEGKWHTLETRLKASWGALKDILKPEMELDECVETLVFLQTTAELKYASQFNVIGSRHYHGADEMLLQLGNLYDLFKGGKLSYEGQRLQDGIIQMRSHTTGKEYTIKASTFSCLCFLMRTMLLPCHHTMFVRCEMNKKKVIPVNYLHPRWLFQSDQNRPEEEGSDDDISCSASSHMRSVKTRCFEWINKVEGGDGFCRSCCGGNELSRNNSFYFYGRSVT
ncbi:hypothetical protein PHMEG_00035450 [Phytophthora megakarya]|uniref:SWIM-type domain-containing protein n=1 Tax=Phytophthora megakarya TaxID=4795 RepID=A0A225UP56_9STRA|nr:hypothetical protein PHMEG_00035450 [Phytophthora megakarya]